MKYKYILSMDPSGSFDEGKGTTGWCVLTHNKVLQVTGSISATKFFSVEEYWSQHLTIIDEFMRKHPKETILVIEDYRLYASKADSQINSRMETCRLLGLIQWYCFFKNYPMVFQQAAEVKHRWEDHVVKKHIELPKINRHELDSIRHALHYFTFKNDLNKKQQKPKAPTVFTNFKEVEDVSVSNKGTIRSYRKTR